MVGLTRKAIFAEAVHLLDEVGLDPVSTRALARRLHVEPSLCWHFRNKAALLETIDPLSAMTITAISNAFVASGGTVLLSTHTMSLVEQVCDDVAVMAHSAVLKSGTVENVSDGRTLAEAFASAVGAPPTTILPRANRHVVQRKPADDYGDYRPWNAADEGRCLIQPQMATTASEENAPKPAEQAKKTSARNTPAADHATLEAVHTDHVATDTPAAVRARMT